MTLTTALLQASNSTLKHKTVVATTRQPQFVVKSWDNKLGKPLYAFYRHPAYSLVKNIYYLELLSGEFVENDSK
jgi:hypothetical protein